MKEKRLFILLSIVVLSILGGISFAFFQFVGEVEEVKVTITSGTLSLTFRDNNDTVGNIEGTWNFGNTIEKELVIENTGTKDTYAKISWDNLINTYLEKSITYTLEEKNDEEGAIYKQIGISRNVPQSETPSKQLLQNGLEILAGHTYTYRVRITLENLLDVDQTVDLHAQFVTTFTLDEGTEDVLSRLIANAKETIPNFANPATTDETADGLYKMTDDYGMSYYFRGASKNNYLKFGKNSSGQDMYWRIIRINGDGSIRMIYDGTQAYANGTSNFDRLAITNQKWNAAYKDAKYVGWMFGGINESASTSKTQAQKNETSSLIKEAVEAWYKSNIVDTGYSGYISDEIFCNDRSIPGKELTGWLPDTGLGYGNNITTYGGFARFINIDESNNLISRDELLPQFKCPQENDKFTVDTKNGGNGALTYPIGLITADEAIAGGSGNAYTSKTNNIYYLYKYQSYYLWTITPCFHYSDGIAKNFGIQKGRLVHPDVKTNNGVISPVINLKPEYLNQLEGTGLINDPFRID